MTREELKKFINADITISGALDINIPEAEIDRIIDLESEQLYELNPEALEEDFIIIHPNVFRSPEFRKNRYIQFPDCVMSVIEFREMKRRNGLFGINDPDISFNRAFQSELWMGSMINFDTVTYRVAQWSAWDLMKQFTLVDIQHSWNRANHKLMVSGHDPLVPVLCKMMVKVKYEDLWDNPYNKKYITARCRLQVYRLLGTFTATLLGGTTINAQAYKEVADQDIQECKDYWKTMFVPTFFINTY